MPHDTLREALQLRPDIARAAAEHGRAVMEDGSVPQSTERLCAVMVCAVNFCEPSLIEQRALARESGATPEMLTALWDFARSDLFTGAQRAALAAAVALTREPRALPEAVRAALEQYYDQGEILEYSARSR